MNSTIQTLLLYYLVYYFNFAKTSCIVSERNVTREFSESKFYSLYENKDLISKLIVQANTSFNNLKFFFQIFRRPETVRRSFDVDTNDSAFLRKMRQ